MPIWTPPSHVTSGPASSAKFNAETVDNLLHLHDLVGPHGAADAAWAAFAPVWRLGPTAITIGNGTNVGRIRRLGKGAEFYARLVIGSTTGFPANGTFTLDLPVPAFEGAIAVRPIGVAAGIDQSTGAGSRATAEIAVAADRVGFFAAGAYWSGTVPWTWAAGDTLMVTGSYERP